MQQARVGIHRLLAAGFIAAGVLHFAAPAPFVRIVPPLLPYPLEIVYISGVCEIVLGALFLAPSFQRIAGCGLILLLIAVFPANIYGALTAATPHPAMPGIPPWLAWLRLPFQPLLIAALEWTRRERQAEL